MAIGLKEAFEAMDYDELMKLKMELETGGFNIKRMVVQKVREKEKLHEKKCATCSAEIEPYSIGNYTLLFGPEDFKKKASFCATDCLEYFLEQLKNRKDYSKNTTE